MKCKDCNADMEEILEENMAVPVRGEFVTREGKIVSLYVCPKCGREYKENWQLKRLRRMAELLNIVRREM